MVYKAYDDGQKENVLNSVCYDIENSLAPITDICKKQSISFRTLQRWSGADEKLAEKLEDTISQRAWRYAEQALVIIDNAPTYFEDGRGGKRDSNASVNKARHQAEFRLRLAETLAPDVFGNLRYEIKAIQKEIDKLKKIVEKESTRNNEVAKWKL